MFHKYPDAPDEVNFLRDRHRHIFKFKVWIEVQHDNRDVEFFMFKKDVNAFIEQLNTLLGINKSCEMISDYLHNQIKEKYHDRKIKISVSEDGENGSEKTYER